MDFFAAEDRAGRATMLLWFLYLLSIIFVAVLTGAVLAYVFALYIDHSTNAFSSTFSTFIPYVTLAVALVVIIATIMKARELQGGGTALGEMFGVRWLNESPSDPAEARLKHVVDEMAIAAGVKTPQICILDNEPGINAFAAGTNNDDPVIGVTAGCLTLLSRDELQGIIGHEFSHILHNDTTLNIRAYAMIFGLLAIEVIGLKMITTMSYSNDPYDRNRGNSGNLVFFVVGLILMVIGWLGGLAGRVVRAAIVRQREFLADASAVQYTRNADGVAGALYKMGVNGSQLNHSTGEEAEHFLFGAGAGSYWGKFGLTRTHPPTISRINAIRPGFQPSTADVVPLTALRDDEADADPDPALTSYLKANTDPAIWTAAQNTLEPGHTDIMNPQTPYDSTPAPATEADLDPALRSTPLLAAVPTAAAAQPGAPAATQHLRYPSTPPPVPPAHLLEKLPQTLLDAAHSTSSAVAVTLALAATNIPTEKWQPSLNQFQSAEFTQSVERYVAQIKPLTLLPRMALIDAVIPAVQNATDNLELLTAAVNALLPLTDQPDVVAMAVMWRLVRYLGADAPIGPTVSTWVEGSHHVAVLIASLCRLQFGAGLMASTAYQSAGAKFYSLGAFPQMPAPADSRPSNIETALAVLAGASSTTKELVVTTAAHIIAQEEIPATAADLLLRLICDAASHDLPNIFDRYI